MTRPVASRLTLTTLAAVLIAAAPAGLTAREHVADPPQARPLTSLTNLAQQARDRVSATPRVALDASVSVKSLGSPEAPAFVRALGAAAGLGRADGRAARRRAVQGHGRSRDQGGDGLAHRAGQRQPVRRGAHAAGAQGARPRRRAAVRDGGQRRQPPVDVGAGGAALCRDPDAHREHRAERVRARRRDVQRQRDRRADDDRQLLQLLHALHRGAAPAGRIVGARRDDDVAGAGRLADAQAPHRVARRRRDHGGGRRARAVQGSGRPAGAEQPRPRHGQLAARDAARAGHPAGVARVRQQLPREGHHRPRHPAAGVVRGVDRQRVPLLHAPPGAGAAAPRRRPDQAAGDAQGRLGADAARAGGGEVRAQAHRSAVRDRRRGLRRDEKEFGDAGALEVSSRPATSPS